ncbi:MAG TPA: carboxymuconolactone decarboxylase family protein [Blastocatellia bacterium]|nr:carboxymuconolactone decarboxylase family protein [Blastocatellia bacterium]
MKKATATATEKVVPARKQKRATSSYTMVEPRFRKKYFEFYQEIYRPGVIDRKTKELISIAASLTAKCQGCLQGHIRKALKLGATREEISETIVTAMSINAAAVIDLTDMAAEHLGLEFFPTNGQPVSSESSNGQPSGD